MISEKMIPLMKNNSAIRMMFEEGNKLAAKYGRENVFDFSLGNPSVPAPAEVNQAIQDIVKEEDSLFVHGYMSNAGYEDVRETIAQSLNRRFGTSFHAGNILMCGKSPGWHFKDPVKSRRAGHYLCTVLCRVWFLCPQL